MCEGSQIFLHARPAGEPGHKPRARDRSTVRLDCSRPLSVQEQSSQPSFKYV